MIIAAAPQPALADSLRAAGCTEVDIVPARRSHRVAHPRARASSSSVIEHGRGCPARRARDPDATSCAAPRSSRSSPSTCSTLRSMPASPIASPRRRVRASCLARARAALRSARPQRRTRRERRLTDELRELQREKQELERIACVDSLTGVANRRHALRLLEAEWKRSARDGTPLSLVMIDLDCFHAFNETLRPPRRRSLPARASPTRWSTACAGRPTILGRYGGEEFIAVLANTDAEGALHRRRAHARRGRGARDPARGIAVLATS